MTNSSNIELSTERKLLATRIKKSSQFSQQETKTYYNNYACTKKTIVISLSKHGYQNISYFNFVHFITDYR